MNRSLDDSHILLVDDDAVLRMMAGQALRRAGFKVDEAGSGEEALAKLASKEVDLVLLDVMMPGIDGFEVCRRLRQAEFGRDLSIVMLTGLDDSDSIEKAYQVGASDFIPKPINWNLLIHRVRYNLRANFIRSRLVASQISLDGAQRLARMGSWEWWPDAGIFSCSDEFARLFGLAPEIRQSITPTILIETVDEGDRPSLRDARHMALSAGKNYQIRFRHTGSNGNKRVFQEDGHVLLASDTMSSSSEAITQDISEAVANEERVRFLSYHDQTTGLPNRQFFLEVAAHTLEQSRRNCGECALLFVDIDHFKDVNATFGNVQGDLILKTLAERIVNCVRASDLSGFAHTPEGIEVAARAGPDEFLILLSQLRRETDASTVADRVLQAIREPFVLDDQEIRLTASIGLALYPRDSDTLSNLVDHAEYAVSTARALGRDSYAFYNEEIGAVASAKIHREGELRQAMAGNQLLLHFQPKVDMASGRIIGAEALVRWQHPEKGLLYPGDFIPLAEECGLIVHMGHHIFSLACQQMRSWREQGVMPERLPIAVNLSALSFNEEGLIEQLIRCAEAHALPLDSICLELTETSLMQQIESTTQRLENLRIAGFRLALDDFGTGYSSLSYLKRFPIDQIKIDRSFVQDIITDPQDVAIVETIITLARKLGLEVVAEGVETVEQANLLNSMGCGTAQGYYFARPMPAAQLTLLLTAQK
ncbi:MAG: EAL domain-containing protein [Dechloromonas sp.]|uniref:EAL domain-containing protein n=1 Tax=Candidatus Dechloromonas phosphorivorans TaxID=2899244 RepID=A0A935MXK5_9RHOO|nr:EAL domain-containing protein [Candidatus Dechloromonas phosphorivorans]